MTAPAEDVDSQPTGQSRQRRAVLLKVLGGVIAVAAIALCVRALASEWSTVSDAVRHAKIWMLVLALITSFLAMAGLAVLWRRSLQLFDVQISVTEATAWYFAGELGKYIPGGVWAVLGRGELVRRSGKSSRSAAYATTLIGYGTMCIGAAVVCGVLAPVLALYGDQFTWAWVMLAMIPVGVVVVHPKVLGSLFALAKKATRGRFDLVAPSWGRMIELVLWAIPTWLLVGVSTVLVTESFGFSERPARVAFAAIAAWIIGFLVVPVPAGAGLRELVFVGVCGLPAAPAVAVAAGARVLMVLADALGGGWGLLYARHHGTPAKAASAEGISSA